MTNTQKETAPNSTETVSTGNFKAKMRVRLGFGAGDMACNFVWQIITIYIAVYYTDVVGIAPAAISLMFLLVRVVDGVTDVLMGIAIDNTKSKYGKSRPWFLWGMVPFCLLGILAFAVPQSWGEAGMLVYAYITYIGLSCAYTMVNIPLASILPTLTDDKKERTVLVSFRMTMSAIGGFAVTLFALPIVKLFHDGGMSQYYSILLTITIYSVIAACLFFFTFTSVKEVVEPERDDTNVKDSFVSLKHNSPWIMFFCNIFLMWGSYFFFTGAIYYYITYVAGVDHIIWLVSGIASILTGTKFLAALSVPYWAKWFKKKHVYLTASCIALVGILGIWASGSSEWAIVLTAIVGGYGMGLRESIYFSMQADPIDYGEWKTTVNSSGLQSAFNGFAGKLIMAIAGSTTMLLITGYVAPIDEINQVQSQSVQLGITFAFIIIPAILTACSGILMGFFWKIDDIQDQMIDELDQRREVASASKLKKAVKATPNKK